MYVVLHGGWRVILTFIAVVVPTYAWILFYYLSTGAWHQSGETVRIHAPLLATFFIPLLVGAWIIGFRGWRVVIGAIVAAVITGWLPAQSIAAKILPDSYINLAIVLILLMIYLRAFRYWRDYVVHNLPVARYTRAGIAVMGVVVVVLSVLLWPLAA